MSNITITKGPGSYIRSKTDNRETVEQQSIIMPNGNYGSVMRDDNNEIITESVNYSGDYSLLEDGVNQILLSNKDTTIVFEENKIRIYTQGFTGRTERIQIKRDLLNNPIYTDQTKTEYQTKIEYQYQGLLPYEYDGTQELAQSLNSIIKG